MKKSLFTLIVLSLCSLLAAQFIVWHNGQIVYQSDINGVDSITFYEYKLPDTPEEPTEPDILSFTYHILHQLFLYYGGQRNIFRCHRAANRRSYSFL